MCLALLQLALPTVSVAEPTFDIDTLETTSISSFGKPAKTLRPLSLGVYDPHDQFRNSNRPHIGHVFVYWQAMDKSMLAAKMRLAEMKGRTEPPSNGI
ncbi:hypothetical protein GCM10010869_50000 [Mesorhizobium tianshanense]|nr:hypothetical protein GCM10010869_50000 [Mesorhizobium tianshanense]